MVLFSLMKVPHIQCPMQRHVNDPTQFMWDPYVCLYSCNTWQNMLDPYACGSIVSQWLVILLDSIEINTLKIAPICPIFAIISPPPKHHLFKGSPYIFYLLFLDLY